VLAWQEDHADPVFALRREVDALSAQIVAIKRVGDLYQDAGPIAAKRIGTDSTAVIEVAQD
jgi:hypothetical protein